MCLQVSLNEVITKSTKALQALRFPPRSDRENGKNIGWLENHGLPGLKYLYKEIIHSGGTTPNSELKIKIDGNAVNFLEARNPSGFLIAQSAVDLAENGKIVTIIKCRYPLILFAEMSRRSHLAFGRKIEWTEGREINTGLSIAGKTAIRLNSKRLDIAGDIKLIAMGAQSLTEGQEIVDRQTTSTEDGICCDSHQWEIICMTAAQMLIPDSKQSHILAPARKLMITFNFSVKSNTRNF